MIEIWSLRSAARDSNWLPTAVRRLYAAFFFLRLNSI